MNWKFGHRPVYIEPFCAISAAYIPLPSFVFILFQHSPFIVVLEEELPEDLCGLFIVVPFCRIFSFCFFLHCSERRKYCPYPCQSPTVLFVSRRISLFSFPSRCQILQGFAETLRYMFVCGTKCLKSLTTRSGIPPQVDTCFLLFFFKGKHLK